MAAGSDAIWAVDLGNCSLKALHLMAVGDVVQVIGFDHIPHGKIISSGVSAAEREEPAAAERLAEAGLAALAAGVDGAEPALRRTLALAPERETARAVLEALVRLARDRRDDAAERDALGALVPLLPTGARPAALLRHAALALAAGDAALARASAEEARALSPRDPSAVDACRVAAVATGDLPRVAELLGELAALEPASAGARLLDRARLLASLGISDETDTAFAAALASLPPDRALAEEHARHRRERMGGRDAAEPIEIYAGRLEDPREAAHALRAAAALAYAAGDLASALRCARRAYARTQDDLAFAAPLLARVLYVQGGGAEALVLHRRLLEAGFPGASPEDLVALCRQAAELADDAGEASLALAACDRLLQLRPQEIDVALRRFELDPERPRAVRELADAAEACRSQRRRALALARAAAGALVETRDRELAERLFRRARQDAARDPVLAADLARRWAEATRAADGATSEAFLAALHDAASTAQAAGDHGAAREHLEQAIAVERERGLLGDAARDLLQVDALAAAAGDFTGSAARTAQAGALLREAGDLAGAADALRRAYAADPGSAEILRGLEEVARAMGTSGTPLLADVLADRAARAPPGAERADVLVALADVHAASGARSEAAAALRAALAERPGEDGTEDRLLALLGDESPVERRERGELLVGRAARATGETRAARLREAARAFYAAGDADRARAALGDAFDAWPAESSAFAEALRAAAAQVDRLDAVLLARAAAVPEEATACHRARGDALQAFGETERAIGAYEAALALDAGDVEARAPLATCLAAARGDAAAREHDLQVIAAWEMRPAEVPAAAEAPSRYRLGLAFVRDGLVAAAVPHLERAVVLAPADPRAAESWAALARGHAARGDTASALAAARARVNCAIATGHDAERRAAVAAEETLAVELGVAPRAEPPTVALDATSGPPRPAHASPAPAPPPHPSPSPPLRGGEGRAEGALRGQDGGREEVLRAGEGRGEEVTPRVDLSESSGPDDPAARAAAWIHIAEELADAGAPPEDVRVALELACEADSDSAEPWRARAGLEARLGNALAAARSHLAVSIRTEGDEAARSALHAARLFEDAERHADAVRAYRAALHATPGCVPAGVLLGAVALAAADGRAAAAHLAAIDPERLPPEVRANHARKLALASALGGAGPAPVEPPPDENAPSSASPSAVDPVAASLCASASAAEGSVRADILERLAFHLDREGDRDGAAEALTEAIEAAPPRDATWSWLLALAPESEERIARADAARRRAEEEFSFAAETPAAETAAADAAAVGEDPATGEGDAPAEYGALPPLDLELPPTEPTERGGEPPPGEPSADPEEAPFSFAAPDESVESVLEPAPSDDPGDLIRDGRRRMEAGDFQGAYERLALALAREPSDITVARDLGRVAERLGLYDEYVQLGEMCADAIGAYDPVAAAARFRHFAEVLRTQLGELERAGVMLEKALALVPGDPDAQRELVALWSARAETAPRALEIWLDLARRDPADAGALAGIAEGCARIAELGGPGAAHLRERGRLAASIGAFVAPALFGQAAPPQLAPHVPVELRARVAAPGATGPLARLLRLLAPWLETLFPADLRRRGAAASDRLDPARAPALAAALEGAAQALWARMHATFVTARSGVDLALENTQPPAIVASAEVAALPAPVLSFLAARSLDLLDHGWALAGKFAPRDLGILLELACRFAGGAPPSLGLPAERAGAFLAVLESQVPPAARAAAAELAAAASAELAETDPRAFTAALRRTANRVGLVYGGDPGAALQALALLDRRLDAGPFDPAQALSLPDLRDLALFALSDPFLDLRATALG